MNSVAAAREQEEIIEFIRTRFDSEISHEYCCTPEEARTWIETAGGYSSANLVATAFTETRRFLEKEAKLGCHYMEEEICSHLIPQFIETEKKRKTERECPKPKLTRSQRYEKDERISGLQKTAKTRCNVDLNEEEAQHALEVALYSVRILLQALNNTQVVQKRRQREFEEPLRRRETLNLIERFTLTEIQKTHKINKPVLGWNAAHEQACLKHNISIPQQGAAKRNTNDNTTYTTIS